MSAMPALLHRRYVRSSLPGLTPQVGFTRLAAHYTAQLGQARVAVQSILFAKTFLRRGWTRGSSPRVTARLAGRGLNEYAALKHKRRCSRGDVPSQTLPRPAAAE